MFQSPVSSKPNVQITCDNVAMAKTVELATCALMVILGVLLAFLGQWMLAIVGIVASAASWFFFDQMLATFAKVNKYFDQTDLALVKDIRLAVDVNRRAANEIGDTYRGNATMRLLMAAIIILFPLVFSTSGAAMIVLGALYACMAVATAGFAALSASKVSGYGPTAQVIAQVQ